MPRIKTKRTEREYLRRIGKTIRHKRVDEYHELQRNIADTAGISTQYLWSIEHGNASSLSILVLRRIARALDTDITALLDDASLPQLHDPLLQSLLTRISRLPDTIRPAALLAMLTLLDDYHRFMNAASTNPHQLALPFAGPERKPLTSQSRWFPSLRDDTSVTPS